MVSSGRVYVRRKVGQRYKNKYICKTLRFGGSSVMVWGCLKVDGSRKLVRYPQRLNSASYHKVLNEGPNGLNEGDLIFVQNLTLSQIEVLIGVLR